MQILRAFFLQKKALTILLYRKKLVSLHTDLRLLSIKINKRREMTKADIINEVAIATGMAKKEVSIVVESFMEEVKKSLIQNKENVHLRGFGSFNIKHRAAKTARNISKNTTLTIPAHDLPSFKPSKSFIEEMQNAQ